MPIVALWLALSAPALAASGYYAPQDVAVASQQFARAQATAGANFASLQARADALAAALVRYETALDLLGSDAPADQRTRQRDLQRRYLREQAVISAFANDQADAFGAAFEAALKRAIAARDLVECHTEAPSLRMGPSFSRAAPVTCSGADENAHIAARMDADPQLTRALEGLLSSGWPSFSLASTPQPAVGGAGASVDLLTLLEQGAPDALRTITEADEDAREAFQSAIDDGASTEARAKLIDQAHEVTTRTALRRAALAGPVIQAVEDLRKKLPKLGIAADFGWCVQPVVFGGCTPTPISADAAAALAAQSKVAAALDHANAARL